MLFREITEAVGRFFSGEIGEAEQATGKYKSENGKNITVGKLNVSPNDGNDLNAVNKSVILPFYGGRLHLENPL